MGLKDLRIPEEIVEVAPGSSFAVRGLTTDDIAFLVQRHGDAMTAEFDRFVELGEDLEPQAIAGFIVPLIDKVPELISDGIACASDDTSPESLAVARRLPFPAQVDAIEKIVKLTFDVAGGPKKLVESVIRLAGGTSALLTDLKT